jgi:hypothetical protein
MQSMHLLEKIRLFRGFYEELRGRCPPLPRELACLKTAPAF